MKSNKGFTLIELLAVIVILAIVALVATPVILNIIQSSTDKAKDSSSRLVIKSVELAYTTYISQSHGNDPVGTTPQIGQLAAEFNGIMDSGTNWDTTTPKANEAITSGNVKCNVVDGTTNNTIKVVCPMTGGQADISTKDLAITPTPQQGGGE